MDIVFVRHGRTEMNKERRYCGITDVDLSQEGIEEVRKTAFMLKDISFDGIFTSPLKRAVQTAEILADHYIIDPRLREINFGLFEGMTYEEIIRKYPSENEQWQEDYVNYCLPQGESLRQVYQRTRDFIDDVSRKYDRVLAVTHGGIIRCALSLVFDNINYFYKFQVLHGMPTVISVDQGYMYVKGINCNFKEEDYV